MGTFSLVKKTKISDIDNTFPLPESDLALNDNGFLYQFKFKESKSERKPYIVKPGIWSIDKKQSGYYLNKTSFTNDSLLEEFVNTRQIEGIVDSFFENLHLYKEFGIETPKRNILLYGPPGGGKSTAIGKVAQKYVSDGRTAVVIWQTDKFESYEIKDFIKNFAYEGVEKIILVAEDLGGIENENRRAPSDSSLLSLLDNQEKTFTIPVMIVSTTNFPENFASNLTNRYGRFDDKIEIGFPPPEARVALLKFFAKEYTTEEAMILIYSKKCEKFPPSTIREAYIRSRIQKKELVVVINSIIEEMALYEKAFSKNKGVGF